MSSSSRLGYIEPRAATVGIGQGMSVQLCFFFFPPCSSSLKSCVLILGIQVSSVGFHVYFQRVVTVVSNSQQRAEGGNRALILVRILFALMLPSAWGGVRRLRVRSLLGLVASHFKALEGHWWPHVPTFAKETLVINTFSLHFEYIGQVLEVNTSWQGTWVHYVSPARLGSLWNFLLCAATGLGPLTHKPRQ